MSNGATMRRIGTGTKWSRDSMASIPDIREIYANERRQGALDAINILPEDSRRVCKNKLIKTAAPSPRTARPPKKRRTALTAETLKDDWVDDELEEGDVEPGDVVTTFCRPQRVERR